MGKSVAVCVRGHVLLWCWAVSTASKLKYSLLEEVGFIVWRYLKQGSGCSECYGILKSLSQATEARDTHWDSSGGTACKAGRECQGCSCHESPPMLGCSIKSPNKPDGLLRDLSALFLWGAISTLSGVHVFSMSSQETSYNIRNMATPSSVTASTSSWAEPGGSWELT